jgi:hypothetical protein
MKMLEFLASLATDPELMSAFRRSPHETLNRLNLTADDQRALLAGDPVALRQAVFTEQAMAAHEATGEVKAPNSPELMPVPPRPAEAPANPELMPPPPKPANSELMPRLVRSNPEMMPPPPKPPEPAPPANPEMMPPPMPEEIPPPRPANPEMMPPPMPEEIPPPRPEKIHPPKHSAGSYQQESVRFEPIDFELDLAQDAMLAGLDSMRSQDQDPCGVWSAEGLTVVGTGMRAGVHMTVETRLAIEQATRVLYLVADPVSEACIRNLNPAAESLWPLYQTGKPRIEIYETIIARILDELESAGDLCVALYGHPGVLSHAAWESIRRARATGKRARMLPAISTEDSLFADLGLDIGRAGLQSFEATRFLYYKYNFDPCAGLLLWQVSVLGEDQWNLQHTEVRPRLQVLTGYLMKFYGPEHEVFLYHAPELPTSRALIERVALRDLPKAEFISISTLYIPPRGQPQMNEENIQALERMEVGNQQSA